MECSRSWTDHLFGCISCNKSKKKNFFFFFWIYICIHITVTCRFIKPTKPTKAHTPKTKQRKPNSMIIWWVSQQSFFFYFIHCLSSIDKTDHDFWSSLSCSRKVIIIILGTVSTLQVQKQHKYLCASEKYLSSVYNSYFFYNA